MAFTLCKWGQAYELNSIFKENYLPYSTVWELLYNLTFGLKDKNGILILNSKN